MIQINSTEVPTLRENDHVSGTPTTTLVLMEYGDYQCSQSGQAHQTIEKLQQHLGNCFCFVFRHFPQPQIHPQSFKAAEISEAAGAQGKFWEMHSMLFSNQKKLEDGDLIEYAANLELDIPRVLQELSEHLYCDRVSEDIDSAAKYGVQQTPTFFISIRHEGGQNLEVLITRILETMIG